MSLIDDFATALGAYPVDDVVITITDVAIQVGTAGSVNVNEVWKFKVNVANNGHLDMKDVTLHVTGKNGTAVALAAAGPFPVAGNNIITTTAITVNSHGSQKTGFLYFKAPPGAHPAGTELVDAHIAGWNAGLDHLLASHAAHSLLPEGAYANQVFP